MSIQNTETRPIPSNGQMTASESDSNALLVEVSWEVANPVGGINAVIRSKVPTMLEKWGSRYLLIGPYISQNVMAVFEPMEPGDDPFGRAVTKMRNMGFQVHYGRWLTSGRPMTVLLPPYSVYDRLAEIKYLLWEHHDISTPGNDDLINSVVAFGWMVKVFMTRLSEPDVNTQPVVAQVHEWMAATSIPEIRRDKLPIRTVFTTHATMLGRYLAMNDPDFYEHLPFYDWAREARHFNIETQVKFERAAAHGAHVFTTVSEVTAKECEALIGRRPEVVTPNGWRLSKYDISHEIQNVHQKNKDLIHEFVRGHFFQNHSFDLDKTMYLFTSGRYEYRNKGYDLTLEALARLNWRLRDAGVDKTIVMFFITKRDYTSINPRVLESRATLDKVRQMVEEIKQQIGDRLFNQTISSVYNKFPDLNDFVDDYWKINLRRSVQTWHNESLPPIVTHNLVDDAHDEVLNFMRTANMLNYKEDRVKIVYHPDFISTTSPLFGMDYLDFVKGCHLGVFPSFYEPWGYTPMECMSFGVPAITSDMAGFGDYLLKTFDNPEKAGVYVVNRVNRSFDEAANQLADQLFSFVKMSRAERITQRYKLVEAAERFDWKNLAKFYEEAYQKALKPNS
ncbi:MAG: glycosyltransferase [Bacteroidia bacterium]|nr:glycosyltransferase [Bacteroidia bacterium]